ncbi:unnamed protein product [Prorocentrum cordatum]|uniref:Uncharacterized protein n=1 Tax=Prorocentrum cordatum TaxID=2364126 RepID=A0ABN9T8Z7_9DINO|nr:unnamed protein product [Polarella glacialis]
MSNSSERLTQMEVSIKSLTDKLQNVCTALKQCTTNDKPYAYKTELKYIGEAAHNSSIRIERMEMLLFRASFADFRAIDQKVEAVRGFKVTDQNMLNDLETSPEKILREGVQAFPRMIRVPDACSPSVCSTLAKRRVVSAMISGCPAQAAWRITIPARQTSHQRNFCLFESSRTSRERLRRRRQGGEQGGRAGEERGQ